MTGAGIWWKERGETRKHPSALEEHSSGLILILVPLYMRVKDFLKKKKKKSLKSVWGIGRLLCV